MRKKKGQLCTEQWFLDACILQPVPLSLLSDPVSIAEELGGFPYHHLSNSEIEKAIVSLLDDGLIELVTNAGAISAREKQPLLIKKALELDEELHEKCIQYRLTTTGASYWEKLANPNWDRFHIHGSWYTNTNTFSKITWFFEATNHQLLGDLIDLHPLKWKMLPNTDEWLDVKPWKATYWKTLPVGLRVVYQCENEDSRNLNFMTAVEREKYKALYGRSWYDSEWDISFSWMHNVDA